MRNAPISLVMSVRPRVAISATPARQISVKCDIGDLYKDKYVKKNLVQIGQKHRTLHIEIVTS
jgi:hypothetical protein